ncbi:MAG TPA: hypothetical protein VF933_09820 [Streptosporangiaceae bacterium]
MGEPVVELAVLFQRKVRVPDEDLTRLTSAARAAGHSWEAMAAACGIRGYEDTAGIVAQPSGILPGAGADLLYRAVQYAMQKITGSRRYPPLTWPCHGCGQQVTDRAATGRPIHTEHGHAPGCTRLARDQEADATARRARLPGLVEASEPARGPLQRHLLTEPITDDCPRCGWHGNFHDSLATIGGDWSTAVCDNCYADLHPAITVTVAFLSVRTPGDQEPFTVIRQRTRSDSPYPDAGQVMTWELRWEHTPLLVDDARGNATEDIIPITRDRAEQITARIAGQYWPPDAAQLPWVTAAYPS